MKLQIKRIPSAENPWEDTGEYLLRSSILQYGIYGTLWKDQIEWLREPENAKRNNIFI